MNKYFTITAALIAAVCQLGLYANVYAAEDTCTSSWRACLPSLDITYDSSCSEIACRSCGNARPLLPSSSGVETTNNYRYETTCPSSYGGVATCSCKLISTKYTCASGYYGTATSSTSGCTACPSNATCAGGNGSTFVCQKGYYQNGSSCSACPGNGTTSGTGAPSISSCYIPAGTSFSDAPGSGTYDQNCPY